MADAMYNYARESFLSGLLNLLTANVKAVLVDTSLYTFSLTHQFLSSIPAGARVFTSGNLSTKTTTDGAFNADPLVLTSVSGAVCSCIVLYVDTGAAGTSTLLVKLDTYSGLPVTPNGGNITITWPTDANKIFRI